MAPMSTRTGKGPSMTQQQEMLVDFSSLVLGFSSAALSYMGLGAGVRPVERNLPVAKQNIDILVMLKEKTKGNLDEEEVALVDRVISDLQMRFADASKNP